LPPKLNSLYLSNHIKLTGDGVSVDHLVEVLGSGKKDRAWVPKIAKDQRWCVLSADRGSHSARQDALPIICAQHGVTLIRISGNLYSRNLKVYGPQLLANWQRLMAALKGPKGAQYLLRLHARIADASHIEATKAPNGFKVENGSVIEDAA
jgi:hypothetical protein